LTGNPANDWLGAKHYVLCCLPSLKQFNGEEITRRDRIVAGQNFHHLQEELRQKSSEIRHEKLSIAALSPPIDE
jgi:hypothetical protein